MTTLQRIAHRPRLPVVLAQRTALPYEVIEVGPALYLGMLAWDGNRWAGDNISIRESLRREGLAA